MNIEIDGTNNSVVGSRYGVGVQRSVHNALYKQFSNFILHLTRKKQMLKWTNVDSEHTHTHMPCK